MERNHPGINSRPAFSPHNKAAPKIAPRKNSEEPFTGFLVGAGTVWLSPEISMEVLFEREADPFHERIHFGALECAVLRRERQVHRKRFFAISDTLPFVGIEPFNRRDERVDIANSTCDVIVFRTAVEEDREVTLGWRER